MSPQPTYTTSNGCPVFNPYSSQQIGTPGPLLLQDHHLLDLMAHFDRERIPERVVHAKGSGAFGEFECTDDVSDITCAKFLTKGKKTPLLTRFSTVGGEQGSPDTARDPRGFSVKLYTEEGIIDWVYNNTPVFFIRNPSKFPLFIHTQKRNPQTGRKDANMFWDFLVNNPESLHQVMVLMSDRGTPASFRHQHGYSGHTYKWVKEDGSFVYVQIHLLSDLGFKTISNEESVKRAGENPDCDREDLFESIQKGDYPTWTCYVQTMTPEQAEKLDFSVFDLTKVWPKKDFPLRRFGRFTLNKNPSNFFAEIEQAAFSPSNTVPGWEPSADPVLQSRLFSYPDTHRHRLGPNFFQIPVNRCPVAHNPFIRDGFMSVDGNYGSEPNYPSSFYPLAYKKNAVPGVTGSQHEVWSATASTFHWADDGDHRQPAALWNVLKNTGQDEALIHNVSGHASAACPEMQKKVCEYFGKASPEIANRLARALGVSTERL